MTDQKLTYEELRSIAREAVQWAHEQPWCGKCGGVSWLDVTRKFPELDSDRGRLAYSMEQDVLCARLSA